MVVGGRGGVKPQGEIGKVPFWQGSLYIELPAWENQVRIEREALFPFALALGGW
jgi:hypothetical protein